MRRALENRAYVACDGFKVMFGKGVPTYLSGRGRGCRCPGREWALDMAGRSGLFYALKKRRCTRCERTAAAPAGDSQVRL